MKRTLAILTPLIFAWCQQAFPQDSKPPIPYEVYKCNASGKAVYQDGLCPTGPSKPLKTHDAKGIEAVKPAPPAEPSGPAPVAIIPYTPSKPLSNSTLSTTPTPCRSTNGGGC